YHLVNPGQLDKKTLRRMNEALAQNAELKTGESTGKVVLDKDKKTAVSLSLRMRILRKIDRLAALSDSTRSEAVEKLALHSVDELIKEYSAKKS
ncbi:tellurium resistance protein TerW, partial [Escherichia coli]|nr:tellurium resistance protein TerW [Escherichia coli]HAX5307715.1 tellurium resistance protein TerW [Escherichia coli O157]EHC4035508.1 tellurium resistance protein TerW [Escherichia coli]EJJ4750032.1 tellurium resistance protein TerW [Escherichia coli]EJZ1072872.1 tellurium resistance protein TerW [Escherichia coli]